ncbi:MAG: hypothetical protein COB36_02855 [Alphaproteobacteria bacterium]|nr:MAG: hypothetical protein COB36_02855 [Alphaproteobacteria bacterium]
MVFFIRRILVISLSFLMFSNISDVSAKNSDDAYQSYYDLPYFISIDDEIGMEEFMQDVLQDMQQRLIQAPRSTKYLDRDGNITRKGLEKYKKLARKHLVTVQKRYFAKLDINKDQVVTLEDISQYFEFNIDDVLELYNVVKQFGDTAFDKVDPVLEGMKKKKHGHTSPQWFLETTLLLFIDLDVDADKKLSAEEILYVTEDVFQKETSRIIAQYESYLALSKDGNSTPLEQVSDAAVKAFNTLDYKRDGMISDKEFSRYLKAHLPKKTECNAPLLGDRSVPIYAVVVGGSNAITSLQFNGSFSELAGHVDVIIEKQNQPINLVLSSFQHMVWSIKGDVSSLNHVLVFGAAGNDEVLAGVAGISYEKVSFMGRKACWDARISSPRALDIKKKGDLKKSLGIFKSLTGRQLSLLREKGMVSRIIVKNSPGVEFSDGIDDALRKMPDGFTREYWDEFLTWKPSGHKSVDIQSVVFGGYAAEVEMLPDWAGFAQLEKEGVIAPLYVDYEKRKVVFLLRKDLLIFPTLRNSKVWRITLIKDRDAIRYPKSSANSLPYCIMSRDGALLRGTQSCSPMDLKYLKDKNDKTSSVKSPVFLALDKYIPVMPANKDSIDISLNIDDRLCKKQYGDQYLKKCVLSDDVLKADVPVYALSLEPKIAGTLSWKDIHTLTFTPSEVWRAGARYTAIIDFDLMKLPKGMYVNGERKATFTFYASEVFVQALNPVVKVHPKFAGINLLSADLVSNYPLSSLSVQAVFVPKNGIQPDEHILAMREYKYMSVDSDDGRPSFEMPNMKRRLEQTIDKYANGEFPTHLLLSGPIGTFPLDMGSSRPVWVSFNKADQQQITEGIKLLIAKSKSGNAAAQLALGKAYLDGNGISKSLSQARKWLTQAARQDNVEAAIQLGHLNLKQYSWYNSSPESFYWFTKAAQTNDKVGQFGLCQFYHDRYGFDDLPEGRKWCHKSAAQGHVPAIHYLGRIYERGFGVEVGYKKALKFYREAAAKGSVKSLANIARFYHLGLGVKQDSKQAYSYAKKALSAAQRDDLFVRNITQRIVADILLDEFNDVKSFKAKKGLIANKVFKDFSKDYVRMWIAQGLTSQWNGGNRSHHIAETIINEQRKQTPKLPEMLYAEAWVILKDGYRFNKGSIAQYNPVARNAAVKILEGLQDDDILEFNVFIDLIYLYLSEKNPDKAEALIEKVRVEKYFDNREVKPLRSRISRYRGRITKDMRMSDNPDDQYVVARRDNYIAEKSDKWNEEYKEDIKNNPNHAWTHGNYASFLLHTRGDYDGAIIYGNKALALMRYPMAQGVTGMAYLVKASQLFKNESTRKQAEKYIRKALSYGIDQWYIKDNCRKFCADIARMGKAYKAARSKKPI